jgi:hypothetical protein
LIIKIIVTVIIITIIIRIIVLVIIIMIVNSNTNNDIKCYVSQQKGFTKFIDKKCDKGELEIIRNELL